MGGGTGFAPAQMDAEIESLLSGGLDGDAPMEPALAATGSEGPAQSAEPALSPEPESPSEAPEA